MLIKESLVSQIKNRIIQFSVDRYIAKELNDDDDLNVYMTSQYIFVLTLLKLNLDVRYYPKTLKYLVSLGLVTV